MIDAREVLRGHEFEQDHRTAALPTADSGVSPDERFASSLTAVGGRLRELRKANGMSLRTLATQSGLSASFLSLVERGECSLSLTSLFAITAALQIDPSAVLNSAIDDTTAPAQCGVWRGVENATAHTRVGEREYFPFVPQLPSQAMTPLYFRIHPTSVVAPLAVHAGEEVAYVCSGELFIQLGEQQLTLRAGDGVHFDSEVPHTIANKTRDDVEALWVTLSRSSHPDAAPHEPPANRS